MREFDPRNELGEVGLFSMPVSKKKVFLRSRRKIHKTFNKPIEDKEGG
jgi:hypothetical protein